MRVPLILAIALGLATSLAHAAHPLDPGVMVGLVQPRVDAKALQDAVTRLKARLAESPDAAPPDALHELMTLHMRIGEPSDVSRVLAAGKAVIMHHPRYSGLDDVMFMLGYAHQRGGDHASAARLYTALIRRFPRSPRVAPALVLLGQSMLTQGKHAKALKILEKVVGDHPADRVTGYALFCLGQAAAAQGQTDVARTHFRALLEGGTLKTSRSARALRAAAEGRLRALGKGG